MMRSAFAHIAALVLLASPLQAQAAASAAELMARLLIASDLAELCPHVAQRRHGQDRETFLSEGMITMINDHDVTMTDFAELQGDIDLDGMVRLQRHILAGRGISADNRRSLCFFAQQIVGSTDDEIGRFLERK